MSVDWPAIVERDALALLDAAASDLAAPVPGMPGVDALELLRHVGTVHTRATVVLETGTMERPVLPDPPTEGVVEWYRATLDGLLPLLREAMANPDRPVYCLFPDHRWAGYWPRRIAHETAVHRVDAQQAAGAPVTPIEPAIAADGVDELLTVLLPVVGEGRSPGDGRTVHLHATDAECEWLLRLDPGTVAVTPGHARADAAVRGPAASLLLWLWGRTPAEPVEVLGDASAAEAFQTATAF